MQHLVLGMHRSGTSALTRVLGLMGCHLGSDDELTPGDAENPKGYFERRDAWALDEWLLERLGGSWHDVTRLDGEAVPAELQVEFAARLQPILERLEPHRPWAVKDPRLCLLLPSWRAGLSAPVGILLHRDPLEVARSLRKRDGFPLAAGLGLWERHTRDALRFTAGMPRVLVRYADLLADPPATAARLLRDLEGQECPRAACTCPTRASCATSSTRPCAGSAPSPARWRTSWPRSSARCSSACRAPARWASSRRRRCRAPAARPWRAWPRRAGASRTPSRCSRA